MEFHYFYVLLMISMLLLFTCYFVLDCFYCWMFLNLCFSFLLSFWNIIHYWTLYTVISFHLVILWLSMGLGVPIEVLVFYRVTMLIFFWGSCRNCCRGYRYLCFILFFASKFSCRFWCICILKRNDVDLYPPHQPPSIGTHLYNFQT